MPEKGVPYYPKNPEGKGIFQDEVDPRWLPKPDVSGGVQLADREGVFAHSFRCLRCTLHFVLFSWARDRHSPATVSCPECGRMGAFFHMLTHLSDSRSFRMDALREPEIYDVWPFRLPRVARRPESLN
jgi:transcription elongation factor Elf1